MNHSCSLKGTGALAMILALTLTALAQTANATEEPPFSAGEGTREEPYEIASAEELDLIRDYPQAHFVLTAHIDLGQPPWNTDQGWVPIGAMHGDGQSLNYDWEHEDNILFTGSLNGNGYVISGLTINRPEIEYVGLFANAYGAHFEHLRLEHVEVHAGSYVGALVGIAYETHIDSTFASGVLTADNWRTYAGGIAGFLGEQSHLKGCHSSVSVSGVPGKSNRYIGGISGQLHNSTITGSYADGTISGYNWVGGITGQVLGEDALLQDSYSSAIVQGISLYAGGVAGTLHTGTIRNSHASGPISGGHYVGGLIGHNTNGKVLRSHATGTVYGTHENIGGLAGGNRLDLAIIEDSYATGSVFSERYNVGGLVGNNYHGAIIRRSFSTGNVTGSSTVGGLVGINGTVNDNRASIIEDSYATGNVTANFWTGGLVGRLVSKLVGVPVIARSYTTGHVTPYASESGPLVGVTQSTTQELPSVYVVDSFYNFDNSGLPHNDIGTGVSAAALMSDTTFARWNLTDIWQIEHEHTYPWLVWQQEPGGFNLAQPLQLHTVVDAGALRLHWHAPVFGSPQAYKVYIDGEPVAQTTAETWTHASASLYETSRFEVAALYADNLQSAFSNVAEGTLHGGFAGGSGLPDDPFLVSTADELFFVRYHRNSHFKLVDPIDLQGYSGPGGQAGQGGWKPIGDQGADALFAGYFDGAELVISNLHIHRPDTDNTGLFGYLQNATIKNMVLLNAQVTGMRNTGGLAGYIGDNTLISNCHVHGVVKGNEQEEWNNDEVGGLVGRSEYSTIERSSTDGQVVASTSSHVGGLVGRQQYSTIRNSYSHSSVTGDRITGGLIGWNYIAGLVEYSYATGQVQGREAVGGLAGNTWPIQGQQATTRTSYWDTERSGTDESSGGTGRTTAQMTYPYDEQTYDGWDFEEVWIADTEGSVNNGYPYLIDTGNLPVNASPVAEAPQHTFSLEQNYPNPFNPVTRLTYTLPEAADVQLTVYSVMGQRVYTLHQGPQAAGRHTVHFDASHLASGVYIYRLQAGSHVQTRQMTLIK